MIRLSVILVLLALQTGCNPGDDDLVSLRDDGLQQYVGFWKNTQGGNEKIEEIIILKKSASKVSVELRGGCIPQPCEWGNRLLSRQLFTEGVLKLDWKKEEMSIHQEFSRTSSGKLELKSQIDLPGEDHDTVYTFGFLRDESKPLFEQIPPQEAFRASLYKNKINGTVGDANQLAPGTILLYQTAEGRYGKIQIRGNDAIITMRWESWNPDGSQFAKSDYMETRAGGYYDMNTGKEITETADCLSDFRMEVDDEESRWLSPQCGAVFTIYHVEP